LLHSSPTSNGIIPVTLPFGPPEYTPQEINAGRLEGGNGPKATGTGFNPPTSCRLAWGGALTRYTVLKLSARSALGAPGQTAAFRIAVRLLSAGVQHRSERSLGAQYQFLGLQSWSSGVQSECSSGIWECNPSAILLLGSAI